MSWIDFSLAHAAIVRKTAVTPGEKARAEYAYRVQVGQLDPLSEEGMRAYEEAEQIASSETSEP